VNLTRPRFSSTLQSIEQSIGQSSYQHSKVSQWTSNVVEQCLKRLTGLGKPFKYIGATFFVMFLPLTGPRTLASLVCQRMRSRVPCTIPSSLCPDLVPSHATAFFVSISLTHIPFLRFSELRHFAKKWSWSAHGKLVLLG
jgi:hypothetical protein